MMAVLAARMLVTAAVVVFALVVAERAGPLLGAMVATLPISAGPAYLFLALDHDPPFVAASAITSLVSVGATSVFVAGHAAAARARTPVSLAAAFAGWGLCLALAGLVPQTLASAAAFSLGATLLCLWATRGVRAGATIPEIPSRPWHLAVRAGAVMLVVAAVTLVGRALGPAAAGYAALLPVVFTSLVVLLQPRIGGGPVAAILSNGLVGLLGYTPALACLNLAAEPLGSGPALGLALAISVGWNGAVVLVRRRAR